MNLIGFILTNLLLNMKYEHIMIIFYYNPSQDHLFFINLILEFNYLMRRNNNLNLELQLLLYNFKLILIIIKLNILQDDLISF